MGGGGTGSDGGADNKGSYHFASFKGSSMNYSWADQKKYTYGT